MRPDFSGRSTVVADIGKAVYGSSALGHLAFALLQIATTLILVLAANTAYADFPRLANFHAGDDFLRANSRPAGTDSSSRTGSSRCPPPRSPS